MKRKIVFLTVMLAGLTLVANAQFRFGVRAGAGLANTRYEVAKQSGTSDGIFSFHAGAAMNYAIEVSGGALEFESGLQIGRYGGKKETEMLGKKLSVTDSRYYLDIPLRAYYRLDLPVVNIYAGLGPQFGIGLLGSRTGAAGEKDKSEDIKWGSDIGQTKRMNIALSMHVGVELMDHLRVGFFYDLGLLNHMNSKIDSDYSKDSALGASVVYYF